MIKALKIVIIIYGAILLLMGLMSIFMPGQLMEMFGFQETTNDLVAVSAIAGIFSITVGIWIIAAGRDPIRHIRWVIFAITKAVLSVVVFIYLILQGYCDFSQFGFAIIMDAVFAVALLALYPWHARRSSD